MSAVWTKLRVLMLPSLDVGVSEGVDVDIGVGLGVGMAEGVDVGMGVGVGVGEALTTVTVPTMPQHPPCTVQ